MDSELGDIKNIQLVKKGAFGQITSQVCRTIVNMKEGVVKMLMSAIPDRGKKMFKKRMQTAVSNNCALTLLHI